MTTEKAKHLARLFEMIKKYRKREEKPEGQATDEEVKDYLRLFFTYSATTRTTNIISKHTAQDVIGHIFRGEDGSPYIFYSQLEKCMQECHFMWITANGEKRYKVKQNVHLKDIQQLATNYHCYANR